MADLPTWLDEIERAMASLGPVPALGIAESGGAELAQRLSSTGHPAVLPLWSGRRNAVGLIGDPSRAPQDWAGVLIDDGQGITISSDGRSLLPQLLLSRISRFPDRILPLVEDWEAIGPRLLALHRTLGGADQSLLEVVSAARDDAFRERLRSDPANRLDFEAAHSALARRIDRSSSFAAYANWLDAAVDGRWEFPSDPAAFGACGRRVLCWWARRQFADPTLSKLSAEWLEVVIEERAGIDSGVSDEPSWAVEAAAASGETMLSEAAMTLSGYSPPSDPFITEILQAMLDEGSSYSGLPHAEAVASLAQASEPKRAWGMLQSAAWWTARTLGEVPVAILGGARLLAEQNGWTDIQFILAHGVEDAP